MTRDDTDRMCRHRQELLSLVERIAGELPGAADSPSSMREIVREMERTVERIRRESGDGE